MKNRETIRPDSIEKVKSSIEENLGIDFAEFFAAYIEKNSDQPDLTEEDLVAEILEAGYEQTDGSESYDDLILIGSMALGVDLGFF